MTTTARRLDEALARNLISHEEHQQLTKRADTTGELGITAALGEPFSRRDLELESHRAGERPSALPAEFHVRSVQTLREQDPDGGGSTVRRCLEVASTQPNGGGLLSYVIGDGFDAEASEILRYAEVRMLEGEPINLDRIAELIASKVHGHLRLTFTPTVRA